MLCLFFVFVCMCACLPDCAMLEQSESEKYYTIPRSGEASAAYKAALQPRRPASTAGGFFLAGQESPETFQCTKHQEDFWKHDIDRC